jgi:hypothetical protein
MPLGEIAGEVLGGVLRFIGQIVGELVFEILVKVPGYAIARMFNSKAHPDGGLSVVLGLLFWACLGLLGYVSYRHFAAGASLVGAG